jgi:hypothetical protein
MHHGEIVGTFHPNEIDPHGVGVLMTGAGPERDDAHDRLAVASDD